MNESTIKAEQKMQGSVSQLIDNLKSIRTGMANASILDKIEVEYYGSPTPLSQVASIKVVEGRQLMIKPYDQSTIKDIERALQTSDVGLVPQGDGEVIRLNIPALTEDRRKELSKDASKLGEDAKIAIRNIRRDANDAVKKMKDFSEDMKKEAQEEIQKLTDKYVKEIEQEVSSKSAEIIKV